MYRNDNIFVEIGCMITLQHFYQALPDLMFTIVFVLAIYGIWKTFSKEALHIQKLTNFGAVFIVRRVMCGKCDGNIKHSHGQT